MSINKLTLKYKDPERESKYSKYKMEHTRNHLPLFFGLSAAAAAYSVIRYIYTGEEGSLIIFISDCVRTLLYIFVYLLAPKVRFIRSYIGTIANVIFAFLLTEGYLLSGEPMFLVVRYLAYQSLVVLGLAEMNVNFFISMVTLWGCKIYILTRSLISSNEFQELLIFVMINSLIVSSILLYHVIYNKKEKFLEMLKNEELHKENFKMAMSVIPDGVVQIKSSKVIFYNEKTLQMLKLGPTDKNELETTPTYLCTDIENILKLIKIKDKSVLDLAIEYENRGQSLNEHFETTISESTNNPFMQIICKTINMGEPSIIILLNDLSAVKLAEKEQAENKYKNLLILTVSHELRTPLNNFSCMLALLRDCIMPEGEKYLNIIDSSYELLVALINDILDYFHISEGGIALKTTKFSPRSIVASVCKLLQFQVEQRGVNIVTNIESSTPNYIYNDKNRFKQIFLNGMNNAVKYTFHGQIIVVMKGFMRDRMKYLKVKIQDTGVGISQEHKPHLFKMFGLVDQTPNNKKSGIGLGLTLVKNISVLMGGDVSIKSEEGMGTILKFWIKAPMTPNTMETLDSANITISTSENNPAQIVRLDHIGFSIQHYNTITNTLQAHDEILSEERIDLMGSNSVLMEPMQFSECDCPHILIVDDNAFNQFSLVQMLKKCNLKSDKADNGEMAIEMINKASMNRRTCCHGFQLIFMDINMPGLNGYDTSRIINDMAATGSIAPIIIIACTAHDSDTHEELCIEAGIVDTIFKPVPFDTLKEKLGYFDLISYTPSSQIIPDGTEQ